ncbi:MAG: 16S rRNA (guanine(966)-N(2))-methyltransferase RsmD [Gammaproteobacteria bacterium]
MKRAAAGTVRIIGGRWRGRRLLVPEAASLRPTSDRVRETLFNWLTPFIEGAACVDLFAGTGALGFEAASRGAARVVMIEKNAPLVRSLHRTVEKLGVENIHTVHADALEWLAGAASPYDIVFLDPPFQEELLPACCSRLVSQQWLAGNALVYVESRKDAPHSGWLSDWRIWRQGSAGAVSYYLLQTR